MASDRALDSLRIYTESSSQLKKLMARVTTEERKELAKARSSMQKVGVKVLEQVVRHTTFQVPSPDPTINPTSDEQLRHLLDGMSDHRAVIHMDHRGERPIFWLTFADDVALALALAKHSADETVAKKQFEITSAGAVAFTKWADATATSARRLAALLHSGTPAAASRRMLCPATGGAGSHDVAQRRRPGAH